jgi:hypothetical protein
MLFCLPNWHLDSTLDIANIKKEHLERNLSQLAAAMLLAAN